jgi:hypothetical protein
MTVRVGVPVRHRIQEKNNVISEIVGATCCRFHTETRRNTGQEYLSHAALSQRFIQGRADECSRSLLCHNVVAGLLFELRNKLAPIGRKRKFRSSGIGAAWSSARCSWQAVLWRYPSPPAQQRPLALGR